MMRIAPRASPGLEDLPPAGPDRGVSGDQARDVAGEVIPSIQGQLVPQPAVELDDQPDALVLDVAVGGASSGPHPALPSGRGIP
jgi:hypothetical protein